MDKNPVVSVVIPVYNCEKYLKACLLSVQKQTFEDFEVFLVCSTKSKDNSVQTARDFCETDQRFHVISVSEGTAGTARNLGIDASRGKYLAFIDGDDSVHPEYLERMINAAQTGDADIVVCGFELYYESSKRVRSSGHRPGNTEYETLPAMKELLRDRTMRFYLWNKLWKSSLFKEHGIRIPDMYYEDAAVCPQLYGFAEKVVSIDYIGYRYKRANSKYKEINMSKVRINDYINTVPIIRNSLEKRGIYKKVKMPFQRHIINVFFSVPLLCIQTRKELERGIFKNSLAGMGKVIKSLRIPAEKLDSEELYKDVVI